MACHPGTRRRRGPAKVNCAAWRNYTAGSFDHFDHTALANLRFWDAPKAGVTAATVLAAQFKDMFAPLGAAPMPHAEPVEDTMLYMEVMAVGNVRFADGVSHITLSFSSLFGTPVGKQAVAWAAARGIGVAWSPGQDPSNQLDAPGGNQGAGSTPPGSAAVGDRYPWPTSRQLFLDPTTPFAPNATLNAAGRAAFGVIWARVAARAAGGAPVAWWTAQWNAVYSLVGRGLHLNNLRPGLCQDTEACVGVDDDARCICGSHQR